MTVSPAGKASTPASLHFEIKSAQLPMVALLLKSLDWPKVAANLLQQFGPDGESPDFFEQDPLVIDFSNIDPEAQYLDPKALIDVLKKCQLVPVAFRAEPVAWKAALLKKGLVQAPLEINRPRATHLDPVEVKQIVVQEVAQEIIREVPGPATMVIDKPLRSGQKVYARGADLVVLAMVNQGAEVVADGNIHVYAPLRGKAMAGARGNTQARIFSLCLEPELISIAGVYRTSENPLPDDVAGKPAQVRLSLDGQEKLLFEPLKS
jgi:septum site-determining protein MinC